MKTILVASSKGGAGKTTLATNLAAHFALDGKRTVLVDADPQANMTSGVGLRGQSAPGGTIYNVLTAADGGALKNPDDFILLHADWQAQGRSHSGILLVYKDNIKGKDMSPQEVARAIGNLMASGLPIDNEIHTLNQWR